MLKRIDERPGLLSRYGRRLRFAKATRYEPEYSWNYEVGSHLNFFDNRLSVELAASTSIAATSS